MIVNVCCLFVFFGSIIFVMIICELIGFIMIVFRCFDVSSFSDNVSSEMVVDVMIIR